MEKFKREPMMSKIVSWTNVNTHTQHSYLYKSFNRPSNLLKPLTFFCDCVSAYQQPCFISEILSIAYYRFQLPCFFQTLNQLLFCTFCVKCIFQWRLKWLCLLSGAYYSNLKGTSNKALQNGPTSAFSSSFIHSPTDGCLLLRQRLKEAISKFRELED